MCALMTGLIPPAQLMSQQAAQAAQTAAAPAAMAAVKRMARAGSKQPGSSQTGC